MYTVYIPPTQNSSFSIMLRMPRFHVIYIMPYNNIIIYVIHKLFKTGHRIECASGHNFATQTILISLLLCIATLLSNCMFNLSPQCPLECFTCFCLSCCSYYKFFFSFKLCLVLFCASEKLVRMLHLWYEPMLSRLSSAHHCVALACARLAVREHTDIVAFECVLQHLKPNVLVHASLTRELRVTRLATKHSTRTFIASYWLSILVTTSLLQARYEEDPV